MSKSQSPRFSGKSLEFLLKASRQKKPDWLDRNRDEFESLLLNPLKHLAAKLKTELSSFATGYNFPQKGIGRMKRSTAKAEEYGGLYRDWMHYSVARPRTSRFETNPNIYFLLNPTDRKDPVLIAGGLYMPSSKQTRAIREAIAADATPFERLFKAVAFSKHFPGGFSDENKAKRPPRGFDPEHPRMDWLKLQSFFVWKPYSMKEFSSPDFAKRVVEDGRQILRLNQLLDLAIEGKWARESVVKTAPRPGLLTVIEGVEALQVKADF